LRYKAVIFDLFGTLIPSYSEKEQRRIVMSMAAILSAPPEIFWESWLNTFKESVLGILPNYEAKIGYICNKSGLNPEQENIRKASQLFLDFEAHSMIPRPEAIRVLSTLKQKGYKIGLISDCTPNTVFLWEHTSLNPFFETAIFSCAVGLKKPDPRIYQMATEQLKVKPEDCLYIGDGSSQELTGALKIGMHPVWLRIPKEINENNFRIDQEEWDGVIISALKEVLDLVD
jgi:putative hydrolase of the HAD superfamily